MLGTRSAYEMNGDREREECCMGMAHILHGINAWKSASGQMTLLKNRRVPICAL